MGDRLLSQVLVLGEVVLSLRGRQITNLQGQDYVQRMLRGSMCASGHLWKTGFCTVVVVIALTSLLGD